MKIHLLIKVFTFLILIPNIAFTALKLIPVKDRKGNFIFESDPKALLSHVSIVIKVGSVHDLKGKAGLSKISFESLFRGTRNKNKDQFHFAVEQLGATIAVDAGFNRTIIQLNVINENMEAAIKLLAEALLSPKLGKKEIKEHLNKELNKLQRDRSNVAKLLSRATRKYLYSGTALAHHYNGSTLSIKNIELRDIKKHIKRYINTSNIIFAVSTKHPKKNVKQWIEKSFQYLPEGEAAKVFKLAENFKKKGRHFIILPQKNYNTVKTIISQVAPKADFAEWHTLTLGSFAFAAGGMSSILFNELREKTGWTYIAFGTYKLPDLPRAYGGTIFLYTAPATKYASLAIPRTLELFENYVKNGLKKEEFNLAADALKASYAFQFAKASTRMSKHVYNVLDGAAFDSISSFRNKIDSVSPSSLKDTLQKVHNTKDIIIAVAGDPKKMRALAKQIPNINKIAVVKDPIISSTK